MTRAIAATLLVMLSGLQSAAFAQTEIDPTTGLQHDGKSVRVRLTVQSIGKAAGDVHVLNSAKTWNEPGNLQIRIGPELHAEFVKQGIERPAFHFAKKTVQATGTIRIRRPGGIDVPGIDLGSVSDIRIVPATEPPRTTPSSASEAVAIEPSQGLANVGKRVRVRLMVQSMGRSSDTYNLNSGKSWDEPGNLQIRFSPDIIDAYEKQGIEKPQQHFYLKQVEVTGVVREIRPGNVRVAAIDLQSVDDLTYVLEATRKAPAVSDLIDRQIDLYLRNGQRLGELTVTGVQTGEAPDSLSSLSVRTADDRVRRYAAAAIEEVVVDGIPLDLSYDRRTRLLAVNPKKREARLKDAEETERRVLALGKRIWPHVSDEEHADWIAQHREFIASVQQHFPELPLRPIESRYYLILTDIPDADAQQYLGYLDTLYDEMCKAFGIPLGSNIWCGKCIVVAFQNRPDFIRFELEMMKNQQNPQQAGGICHGTGTGRVVISLFKGSFTARFATVLVHETSHGFVSRFLSDIRIPSWLNEGMAVWIAGFIVKDDDTLQKSQRKSIAAIRQQQTLTGFFEANQIDGDYYGCGSALVDLLIRKDEKKFREFFVDLKKGYPQENALQRAYDLSFDDLAQLYGRSIGLPDLQR
ncbi:hypothetical protein GC176_14860 [bacterium]|nr:hypothetical protein [bacterium]